MTISFIKIVDISVRVVLFPQKNLILKKKLIKEIGYYYKGFIVDRTNNIYFTINIKNIGDYRSQEIVSVNKIIYFSFYNKTNNRIDTNYYISIFQFQVLLRNIYEEYLLSKGFIMHASANIINNKAYVFLAESGGGKSTITKILSKQNCPSVADDNIIIYFKRNKFRLYQAPIIDKTIRSKSNYKNYPINKIFFIKKSTTTFTKKINNTSKILLLLLKQVFIKKKFDYTGRKTVKILINFVENNNFYFLSFSKNGSNLSKIVN